VREFCCAPSDGFVWTQRPESAVKSINMIAERRALDFDRVHHESADGPTLQAQSLPALLPFRTLTIDDDFEFPDLLLRFRIGGRVDSVCLVHSLVVLLRQ